VYDFAKLPPDEIERLTSAGSICGILEQDAPAPRRRFLRWIPAVAAWSMRLAPAQIPGGKGTIRGLVVDIQGAPIGGARIVLNKERYASGDWKGSFALTNLEPRTYRLSIEASGFAVKRMEVVVSSGRDTDLGRIALSVGTVGEVIVIDTQRLSAAP
jgi:hypothetical protein